MPTKIPKELVRALWSAAGLTPEQLRVELRRLKRGSVAFAIVGAAKALSGGDAVRAIQILRHKRAQSNEIGRLVIDEILGPLLLSRNEVAAVAACLDDTTAFGDFVGSRQALKSLCYAVGARPAASRNARELLCKDELNIDAPLLRAAALQRCAMAAFYCKDFEEANDAALRAVSILEELRAFRGAAGAFSILYAIHHSISEDFERAKDFAGRWETAGKKCGNASIETAALVAQYEMAMEAADDELLAKLRAQLSRKPLPQQFRERFPQMLADAIPSGWGRDFSAMKAAFELIDTISTLPSDEKALAMALRSLAEAAAGEVSESRRHVRMAIALSRADNRQSSIATRYKRIARLLAGATCILIGDGSRGRRLFAAKACDALQAQLVTSIAQGAHWQQARPPLRGYARLLYEARAAMLLNEKGNFGVTVSELAVLRMLAEGMSAPQIAAETGRSVHTIRVHTRSIIAKLSVKGRSAAIARARRHGMLD